jgi:hypothetical protein
MILEGMMIIIAVLALTLVHPLFAFSGAWADASWSLRGQSKKGEESGDDTNKAGGDEFKLEEQQ